MNRVLLISGLIIISILLSMLVVFIVAMSTGHSFTDSLLCGVTYYRKCNNDKYESTHIYNDNEYEKIGGISGIGWVL